jgi:hypothetical protein
MPTIVHISADSYPATKQNFISNNYSRTVTSSQTIRLFRSLNHNSWLLMTDNHVYIKQEEKETIVKGNLSIIVQKLKNIWIPRQTIQVITTEYYNTKKNWIKTMQLQIGSVNRGVLILSELENNQLAISPLNTYWEADPVSGLFRIVMKIILNK